MIVKNLDLKFEDLENLPIFTLTYKLNNNN